LLAVCVVEEIGHRNVGVNPNPAKCKAQTLGFLGYDGAVFEPRSGQTAVLDRNADAQYPDLTAAPPEPPRRHAGRPQVGIMGDNLVDQECADNAAKVLVGVVENRSAHCYSIPWLTEDGGHRGFQTRQRRLTRWVSPRRRYSSGRACNARIKDTL